MARSEPALSRRAALAPWAETQEITPENVPLVDFHLHTTWTDGKNKPREMYNKAVEEGLCRVLFSEHARSTSGEWFPRFAAEIRALPTSPCRALVGVETRVADFDGRLEAEENILSECDLVMASVHRFPGEKGVIRGFADVDPAEAVALELRLALAALDNPAVDILGHPFGMSLRRFHRSPTEADFRKIFRKASGTKAAVEINAHYHPDPWALIRWCREEGARISLGSNAHDTGGVGRITRVLQGRESA